VDVVAELALRDGPGALVVALESSDLAPKHRGGAVTVVINKEVVEGCMGVKALHRVDGTGRGIGEE
jgi:hypothetical protein